MARLAFKVNIDHALSNFIGLKDVYDTSIDEGLRATAEIVRDLVIDKYRMASSAPQHPLTWAKKAMTGYDPVNIPNKVEIDYDDKGMLRVGFFETDRESMRIIYLQEFGGNIRVTEDMREWYNTMAFISQGWVPDRGTTRPSDFVFPFPPLYKNTTHMLIPAKLFLRNAFAEVGNSAILTNRLRFALESHMRGGRIPAGTTLGSPSAEDRHLGDTAGFDRDRA